MNMATADDKVRNIILWYAMYWSRASSTRSAFHRLRQRTSVKCFLLNCSLTDFMILVIVVFSYIQTYILFRI